jgi:hypothetical protein
MGWVRVGSCTEEGTRLGVNRTVVAEDLERLRLSGTNALLEPPSADGRFIARGNLESWNWYGYRTVDFEGNERSSGHPYPGTYVEGLKWYMDQAYSGGRSPMYTFVSVGAFVKPLHTGAPYNGQDVLSCAAYRAFIQDERARYDPTNATLAYRIPNTECAQQSSRPFWEWNLRYVVRNLRDHPGLLGWFLWDEPEGATHRHLFGIVSPDAPVPTYTGPESLPTPDLLRYAYRLIKEFEREGRPPQYQTHPVAVDISSAEAFFSRRFSWSRDGSLRPIYESGPFDRTPQGDYQIPADVIGVEASSSLVHARDGSGDTWHAWYWDGNFPSRNAEMLAEAVEHDGLWATLVLAAQAQLPSRGPHQLQEPLRCEPNDNDRTRLLNDRDLVWQLLTFPASGLRGQLYYAHALLPAKGPGAEQARRTNQAIQQFQRAELDQVFLTPQVRSAWSVAYINLHALTNYYRSSPSFTGSAADYDPGLSARSPRERRLSLSQYKVGNFGRTDTPWAYGHATPTPSAQTTHEDHQLLRAAVHEYGNNVYLVVSNVFDARITASIELDATLTGTREVNEGTFDLNRGGRFRWERAQSRIALDSMLGRMTLAVEMAPYEARVFRIR